ncbi:exodeoxyribonuclease V subunit gamma [Silanimonas sp.]|jgi:exodeoxyribonuclease V gamma subunit|uniref:exodeoxyribonuclease V subunit gamma n=1 Tax=Silanimonas sp. TaxID=1929290 RepID=UPI0037CA78C7
MRNEWTIDPERGLWLFRASRLEVLLDPLEALLSHLPPASLLAPQTVLVGHPGLRHWLRDGLARKRRDGIVAHLDIVLPSPWLDGLARRVLGEPLLGIRAWQREVLRWRLLPLLPQLDDPRVVAALAGDDDGREAFALADRLAAALSPLMVYREGWLRRWDEGREAIAGDALLRSAWRALRRGPASRHRGERLVALARRLREGPPPAGLDDGPLHVFGLNHLPPLELDVLSALARHRPVVFHVADPCREHWVGLPSGREAMQRALNLEDRGESEFLALDHPLLAAWGRLGQHFLLELERAELALEERSGKDWEERADDPAPRALLPRLQRSVLLNDMAALAPPPGLPREEARTDASLRVHACATPLRELEVLHDALCAAFADIKGLQPAEVVVVSPRIERYRALIPAVFGEPGRRDGPWPYHLADIPLSATHPIYRALDMALALPTRRLTAQGVLDLLDIDAVAMRFGLDGGHRDTLRHALERARVAWGLDGADRARFGAPDDDTHSLAWGLDRAMAGHVYGGREPGVRALPDGQPVLPLDGVDAGVAEALGRAHALLLELREWVALGRSAQGGDDWAAALQRRFEALLGAPALDAEGREALDTAKGLVVALREEWRDAGLVTPLRWAAVREALLAKLEAVPERQRFLIGGITFCGMVPQRAIPFRVVAVLGLDEGALPRHVEDGGLDLRRLKPQRGDRDLASDDRYLFLETVMAARERLHLSHVGIGANDGRPRNPAAPLAELLDTLARFGDASTDDEAHTLFDTDSGLWPWQRRAPLQPATLVAALASETPSTTNDAAPADATLPTSALDLDTLCRFFQQPAQQVLQHVYGVRLDALDDDRLDENEPLLPRSDPREAWAKRMLLDALAKGTTTISEQPPEAWRLDGRLPPGALGEAAWEKEAEKAQKALAALRPSEGPLPWPLPPAQSRPVRLALQNGELRGQVAVHEAADGTLWLMDAAPGKSPNDLHFGLRLPAFLRWAALRASTDAPVRVALLTTKGLAPWGEALAAGDATQRIARVQALVAYRAAVLAGERRYSPGTSWAAANADADDDEAIVKVWEGADFSTGERDYAPGYAGLLGRDWHLHPGSESLDRFRDDARALVACLPKDADATGAKEDAE